MQWNPIHTALANGRMKEFNFELKPGLIEHPQRSEIMELGTQNSLKIPKLYNLHDMYKIASRNFQSLIL